MDAFNPFRTQIQTLGNQALSANKQMVEWQIGQVKLAEKQTNAAFEAFRSGVEANLAASQSMGKAMLDAMVATETKA